MLFLIGLAFFYSQAALFSIVFTSILYIQVQGAKIKNMKYVRTYVLKIYVFMYVRTLMYIAIRLAGKTNSQLKFYAIVSYTYKKLNLKREVGINIRSKETK